jgi:hypothetical protein
MSATDPTYGDWSDCPPLSERAVLRFLRMVGIRCRLPIRSTWLLPSVRGRVDGSRWRISQMPHDAFAAPFRCHADT